MGTSYTPDELPHRGKQGERLASILAPVLRGDTPSVTVHGSSGTGKTEAVRYVGREFESACQGIGVDCAFERVDCGARGTRYRILAHLARRFGREDVPKTGWHTGLAYDAFVDAVDSCEQSVVVVLDGIDRLAKAYRDNVLYDLLRVNSDTEGANVALVCVSRSLGFTETLDPRVRSSLDRYTVFFPSYGADELSDVLGQRAEIAFKDSVLSEGVVPLCADLVAEEKDGDARRALGLLRAAGERAAGSDTVVEQNVLKAWARRRLPYEGRTDGRHLEEYKT